MPIVADDTSLRSILTDSRSVLVLGAKAGEFEAAYYVPAYLHAHGKSVQGVNPKLAGRDWLGQPAVAEISAGAPADVIEVFRRSDALPEVAETILALSWRPKVVWFQLGIRHDDAAQRLSDAGITVVQDRCMMPEHRRLIKPHASCQT